MLLSHSAHHHYHTNILYTRTHAHIHAQHARMYTHARTHTDLVLIDVFLTSIDNSNNAKFHWDHWEDEGGREEKAQILPLKQ